MLLILTPRGTGARVIELARGHQAVNLARWESADGEDPLDTVLVHVSNRRVGALLDELQGLPGTRVTLIPRGVLALRPPPDRAPAQVVDVQMRSPLEVYLGGLQSIGSWTGFLGYAAASGIVVWVGLLTGTVYLLVAAMLIAPFAGPAMNAAIATARGDAGLLGSSLLRYFCGLAAAVAVAALLSLALGPPGATAAMEQVGRVSPVAVLLPLSAGLAGALNLVQSQRDSLVSGAAVGIMVAAALTPPAGVVGMALVLGRGDLVLSGTFLLLLQLAGINLAGSVVFRLSGITPRGARYPAGSPGVSAASLGASLLLTGLLVALQLAGGPRPGP